MNKLRLAPLVLAAALAAGCSYVPVGSYYYEPAPVVVAPYVVVPPPLYYYPAPPYYPYYAPCWGCGYHYGGYWHGGGWRHWR